MTTSTFSFAMSPPLRRHDVGLVGNPEGGVALHGSIHDIDGVAAQDGIDKACCRPGPAFDLVLAHAAHELALVGGRERRKLAARRLLAGAIDGADGGAV